MKVALLGLSYRTAPVEVRERFAFRGEELAGAMRRLQSQAGAAECLILSTCNRVEVYVAAPEVDFTALEDFLASYHEIPPEAVRPHLYRREGKEAVRHVFNVACSLDSMILGETEILGQLKSAYQAARACGTAGGLLGVMLEKSFQVAKRVRSATALGAYRVSVASAAIDLAGKVFSTLREKEVLLLGTGKVAESIVCALKDVGCRRLRVLSRERERAREFAARHGGEAGCWEEAQEHLLSADLVLASSAPPHFLLCPENMAPVLAARRGRRLLIIDLGVPRNVAPALGVNDQLYLYDIDDLQEVADLGHRQRRDAAEAARRLVEAAASAFHEQYCRAEVVSVCRRLAELSKRRAAEEFDRHAAELAGLSDEQKRLVQHMLNHALGRVMHLPLSALKHAGRQGDGALFAATAAQLFHLGNLPEEKPPEDRPNP